MSKVVCIIPARMASSRFPGKPIQKILGVPMVEHVYRRVKLSKNIDEIYIATCDLEIAEVVNSFGGQVIMTSDKHTRGTDRIAEAARQIDANIIINVQGDEPLVDPNTLDAAVRFMLSDENKKCLNLVSVIKDWEDFISPNVVKVVTDFRKCVLYFSRQPIPLQKKETFDEAIRQIGIYLFRKNFLLEFSSWDETPLEKKEGVDMMRIIERGFSIDTFVSKDMLSVDTPAELLIMEKILEQDGVYQQIFKKT